MFSIYNPEQAFEAAVVEVVWSFWQYFGIEYCNIVPATTADDALLFDFLDWTLALEFLTDESLLGFQPYYFQSATELGYPDIPYMHLLDLLQQPYGDLPDGIFPAGVTVTFDPAPMMDIDTWVRTQGHRLMFIYGEYDPWTAGAFELGSATESHKLIAAQANHGASIMDLSEADRMAAEAALAAWTGVTPSRVAGPRDPMRRAPRH
jgi:hypothetical protein